MGTSGGNSPSIQTRPATSSWTRLPAAGVDRGRVAGHDLHDLQPVDRRSDRLGDLCLGHLGSLVSDAERAGCPNSRALRTCSQGLVVVLGTVARAGPAGANAKTFT